MLEPMLLTHYYCYSSCTDITMLGNYFFYQKCPLTENATFDRLKPRHSNDRKRNLSPIPPPGQGAQENDDNKVRKVEFKREYSKLRKLVPALNERSDTTKVSKYILNHCIDLIYYQHKQCYTYLHLSFSQVEIIEEISKKSYPYDMRSTYFQTPSKALN